MNRGAIRLRAMEPEDLDFLYGMENDCDMWSVGNTSVPYSRYVLHDYIANATNDIYHDGQVRLIMENSEGEAVGIVDVFDFNAQHRRAEVSVAVHKTHRRHGYAESALSLVVDYSLHTLHLHQLYAIVAEDNIASQRLFGKMGFGKGVMLQEWLFDGEKYKKAIVFNKLL